MQKFLSQRAKIVFTLIFLPLLYFYPAVIGKVGLLDGDGWSYALGLRLLVARTISDVTLPLWNPYIFGGMPLLASLQSGPLYPLNWPFAFLPTGLASKITLIACFHLSLTGMYLYARSINGNRLSGLVAGIIFTFGGFMISHIEPTNIIATAIWLPWILLAIERLRQRVSWMWIALGAVFLALQVIAGHPQPTVYSFLVVGAYAVFSLIFRIERERRLRFAFALAAVGVCGLLLAAIQLLPTLELQQQGERAKISYEFFSSFAMPPRRLLTLIFPFFFGGYALPPYQTMFWDSWWETKWICMYAGMLGLLLSFTAVFVGRRKPLVWFWVGIVFVSLILAMGPHLPFGLNYLLYRVPGLNAFRCSYRHLYEFSFALATLAGIGMNNLAELETAKAMRLARRAATLLVALVAGTAILYCVYQQQLGRFSAPSASISLLANAEAYLPLIFCALSLAALWFYVRKRSDLAGAGLLFVLLLDLASFGHFFYWRTLDPHMVDRLADSATTKFIKSRETDLNSFRLISQPKGNNPDLLNSPNISIARGLQSLNGYDPMRLSGFADLTGQMDMFGMPQDLGIYSMAHQGLNLLNAKYLLYEGVGKPDPKYDGVGFSQLELNLSLKPGDQIDLTPNGAMATELAIVSMMGNSTHLADGTPIAQVRLQLKNGQIIEREVLAGRDTAEWAYDRADVRAAIKHKRPAIAESFNVENFQGHRYLGRLAFDRAEVQLIEFRYVCPDATLNVARASLHDSQTGISTPLDSLALPSERWRRLENFGEVYVYENLKALPRAWFVPKVITEPRAKILQIIKQGKFDDGSFFDPARIALLETGSLEPPTIPAAKSDEPAAQVQITNYQPQRIELTATNSQPGFLILSEIFYPGWEAEVDGQPVKIHRTNYDLRGIATEPGQHHIVFAYRPRSFRRGAICSLIGVGLLLIGVTFGRRKWPASR
jgi:hypothetical protein